jgi:hypothetical protein
MSLKQLADELAARGRNGDTELVHMSKGEVAGLQSLAQAAGGSLTINPDTGKPEAFFLAALLPTLLGGVGASMGLGALGTAALGAGVGALTNKKNPLMGAIMGGMGGMGGGNIANALTNAGTTTAQVAAMPAAQAAGDAATQQAMQEFAARQAMAAGSQLSGAEAAQAAMQGVSMPTVDLAAPNLDVIRNQAMGKAYMAATPSGSDAIYQGIGALKGQTGRDAFMQSIGGGKGLMRSGMMGAAPLAYGYMSQTPKQPGEYEDTEDLMGRYTYNAGYTGGIRIPGSAETGEREWYRNPRFVRNFAEGGGIADLAKGGLKAGGFVIPADAVSMAGEGNTEAGYDRIAKAIPGAVPIKGKDGGQADTVATSIEGKQPARVAHGEMYVPPAAVKRAGGAKKLYAMMNNVRKQAKGDAKQIKPVDLKKAMA